MTGKIDDPALFTAPSKLSLGTYHFCLSGALWLVYDWGSAHRVAVG